MGVHVRKRYRCKEELKSKGNKIGYHYMYTDIIAT